MPLCRRQVLLMGLVLGETASSAWSLPQRRSISKCQRLIATCSSRTLRCHRAALAGFQR